MLWVLLAASCRGSAVEASPSHTPIPIQTAEKASVVLTALGTEPAVTFAPIVTMTVAASPKTTATATAQCAPPAKPQNTQYDVDATVDAETRSANAVMHVNYRNETGQPQHQIVFDVEPNRKPGLFTLIGIEAKGAGGVMSYNLTGPSLEVQLQGTLEDHCPIEFMLRFSARTNSIPEGYAAKDGYYGFSDRQLNLSEWMPAITPFFDGQWQTTKAWTLGEYTIWDMADYDVRVTVQGGDANTMQVIGPGEETRVNANTWRYQIANARTFALSIGNSMNKLSATSDDGVTIDLYYFPKTQPNKAADGTPISGPQHALDTARGAVNRYTRLYGPSPYKRIVVVEADFPDGMEFSGLVFVGHQWFAVYDGKPDSMVTLITAHEVAHQWWYSLVGDDQATEPYLDESLAIYSEVLYLEERYPALIPWWWSYRVKQWQPIGYVDSSIYDFQSVRLYINAIYLRGALMLQEIRDKIGDDDFFRWLRAYEAVGTGKIATAYELWAAMPTADYAKTADIRAKYLHQVDPLHPTTPTPATEPATQPAAPVSVRK